MKSQQEIMATMYCTLGELQSGTTVSNPGLDTMLRNQLEILSDILADDIPEEFWPQIEAELR